MRKYILGFSLIRKPHRNEYVELYMILHRAKQRGYHRITTYFRIWRAR